jgi:YcxB-like protein
MLNCAVTMAIPNVIDLAVQARFAELYSAFLKYSFHKLRYMLLIALLIFILTGLALIHASNLDPPDDRWTNLALNVKPLFTLSWVFFLIVPITSLINAVKTSRDPRRSSGFKYHVTDSGMHIEGSTGSSDLNWTAFLEVREVSGAFFMFVTGALFHIIPKRCFSSSEDMVRFREIIRANIPKAKLR